MALKVGLDVSIDYVWVWNGTKGKGEEDVSAHAYVTNDETDTNLNSQRALHKCLLSLTGTMLRV
jgi:hypothetical protein